MQIKKHEKLIFNHYRKILTRYVEVNYKIRVKVRFNRNKNYSGSSITYLAKKKVNIYISLYHNLNATNLIETLVHELAHAINDCPNSDSHNESWGKKYAELITIYYQELRNKKT